MPKPPAPSPPEAMPRRKRRSLDEIRTLLLDAARAEFERSGYAGATTAAIAARAEATEAQLFRYFRSKAELFNAAVLDRLNGAFAAFNAERLDVNTTEDDWEQETQTYIAELSAFIRGHEHLIMSLIVAQAYASTNVEGVAKVGGLRAYFDISADKMRSHVAEDARVDPKLLVRVSFGAVLAAVLFRDWLFADTGADDAAITLALADFVRHGIRVNHMAEEDDRPRPRPPRRGRQARPAIRSIR